ncbi:MAG: hypothetical protein KDB07_09125, partial [Planctomycetes bacterium]|nr:hypothetical protein [Planctomycetota bacterium]
MAAKARSFFAELKKTLSYCAPQKRFYWIALLSLLFVDIADVAAPYLIKLGIEAVENKQGGVLAHYLPAEWFGEGAAYYGMWVYGLAYFCVIVFAGYFRYWMSMSISRASINIAYDTRNALYHKVQSLPSTWHDHSTTGKVMSLATNDMDACRFFWGIGLLLAVDTAIYFTLTPFMMAEISWRLTLVCLVPAFFMPLVIARIAKKIEDNFEHVQESFSVLSEQASESFNGAKVVKSFAAEPQEVERYRDLSEHYRTRSMRLAFWQRLEDPTLMLFIGLMQVLVLGYGGYLVLTEVINASGLVASFFYLQRLYFPMMELGFVIALYQRCVVSRRRIEEVLEMPVAIASNPNAKAPSEVAGAL